MADAGCQCVYVVDSAGALIMEQTYDRVAALVAELGDDAQVGFHGHENLGMGIANSLFAARAGAQQIDGSTRRFGAGAGNTPVEGFVAVADKLGVKTGIDVRKIIDAAEDVVRPVMDGECLLDRLSLTMGYAGVYSSLPQARRPALQAVRRQRRRAAHPRGRAQAGRRPGGPAHRHRARDRGRAARDPHGRRHPQDRHGRRARPRLPRRRRRPAGRVPARLRSGRHRAGPTSATTCRRCRGSARSSSTRSASVRPVGRTSTSATTWRSPLEPCSGCSTPSGLEQVGHRRQLDGRRRRRTRSPLTTRTGCRGCCSTGPAGTGRRCSGRRRPRASRG